MTTSGSSLFFTAPHDEASFYSLPYVEELMWCSEWVRGSSFVTAHPTSTMVPAKDEATGSVELGAGAAAAIAGANTGKAPANSSAAAAAAAAAAHPTPAAALLARVTEDYTIPDCAVSQYESTGNLDGPEIYHLLQARMAAERYYEEHYATVSQQMAEEAMLISSRCAAITKDPATASSIPTLSSETVSPTKKGGGKRGDGHHKGGGGAALEESATGTDITIDLSTREGLNCMIHLQPQRGPQLPLRLATMSPLQRLRTGLSRALGLSVPPQDLPSDDLCLGRTRCSLKKVVPGAHPFRYDAMASLLNAQQHHHHGPSSEGRSNYSPSMCSNAPETASSSPRRQSAPESLETSSAHAAMDALCSEDEDDGAMPPALEYHVSHWFTESSQEELREAALLDWFEDVLGFARQQAFTTPQVRVLLLMSRTMLECVYHLDSLLIGMTGDDDAQDRVVLECVTDVFTSLCTAVGCEGEVEAIEEETRREAVSTEEPDREALAALEVKNKKDKGRSKPAPSPSPQQQQRKASSIVPLVTTTVIKDIVVEMRKTLRYPPSFSIVQLAAVLDFITSSVAGHWRLLSTVLHHRAAPRDVITLNVVTDTTLRWGVAPLTTFLPATFFSQQQERLRVWAEAERSLQNQYENEYGRGLEDLMTEERADRDEITGEKLAGDADNRTMALDTAGFDRVQQAFALRLQHQQEENFAVGIASGQEAFLKELGVMSDLMEAEAEAAQAGGAGGGGAGGKRGAPPKAAVPPAPPVPASKRPMSSARSAVVSADQVNVPTDAVFRIEEVEQRVDVIGDTVQQAIAQAAAKKEGSGKHGKDGRKK